MSSGSNDLRESLDSPKTPTIAFDRDMVSSARKYKVPILGTQKYSRTTLQPVKAKSPSPLGKPNKKKKWPQDFPLLRSFLEDQPASVRSLALLELSRFREGALNLPPEFAEGKDITNNLASETSENSLKEKIEQDDPSEPLRAELALAKSKLAELQAELGRKEATNVEIILKRQLRDVEEAMSIKVESLAKRVRELNKLTSASTSHNRVDSLQSTQLQRLLQLTQEELGVRLAELIDLSNEAEQSLAQPEDNLAGQVVALEQIHGEIGSRKTELLKLAGCLENRLVEVYNLITRVSSLLGTEI